MESVGPEAAYFLAQNFLSAESLKQNFAAISNQNSTSNKKIMDVNNQGINNHQ